MIFLLQTEIDTGALPGFFTPVVAIIFFAGALGWLAATIIGFTHARSGGKGTRLFAFVALALLLYHVQWLVVALILIGRNMKMAVELLSLFNLFVALGAIFAILGFNRLKVP